MQDVPVPAALTQALKSESDRAQAPLSDTNFTINVAAARRTNGIRYTGFHTRSAHYSREGPRVPARNGFSEPKNGNGLTVVTGSGKRTKFKSEMENWNVGESGYQLSSRRQTGVISRKSGLLFNCPALSLVDPGGLPPGLRARNAGERQLALANELLQ